MDRGDWRWVTLLGSRLRMAREGEGDDYEVELG